MFNQYDANKLCFLLIRIIDCCAVLSYYTLSMGLVISSAQMKKQSTRETKNMIQTALWLPRGLYEYLKKTGGKRGLGEEIRRRLIIAVNEVPIAADRTTDELVDQIKDIARELSRDGPWHANRFTYDVFKAAVDTLLLKRQPSSEAEPETKVRLQAAYKADTAEAIGVTIAHATLIAHAREHEKKAFLEEFTGAAWKPLVIGTRVPEGSKGPKE